MNKTDCSIWKDFYIGIFERKRNFKENCVCSFTGKVRLKIQDFVIF